MFFIFRTARTLQCETVKFSVNGGESVTSWVEVVYSTSCVDVICDCELCFLFPCWCYRTVSLQCRAMFNYECVK